MQVIPPLLLPILRSASQARLLTTILLSPDREYTLSELADAARVSPSTATREVQRAEAAGVAVTRELGRSRLVRADKEGVLGKPLSLLLLLAFGPAMIAREELAAVEGVDSAWIFGSWAARYAGITEASPNDLDVLVVGNPERDEAYAAAKRIERRVARSVHVTFRTTAQWERPEDDPFLVEVKARPLLRVDPAEAAG